MQINNPNLKNIHLHSNMQCTRNHKEYKKLYMYMMTKHVTQNEIVCEYVKGLQHHLHHCL